MQVDASKPATVPTNQQEQDCETEGYNSDEAAALNVHEPLTIAFVEEVKALGRFDQSRTSEC